jgi:3-oxoadipate enol-lactonase
MPYLRLNGTRLYYEDTGGRGRPAIVFSHGLLWDTRLYEAQVSRFSDQYRCIAYDHRGQGRSAGHEAASVPMELLYEDAVGLIEALCDGPCHFVGLSMGGFVGLRVAARRAALIRSLVLLSTQAGPEDAGKIRRYGALSWVARAGGAPLLAPQIMSILFGRAFLRDPSRAQERALYQRRLEALPRQIHRAVRGVIERAEISRELGKISAPVAGAAWGSGRGDPAGEGARDGGADPGRAAGGVAGGRSQPDAGGAAPGQPGDGGLLGVAQLRSQAGCQPSAQAWRRSARARRGSASTPRPSASILERPKQAAGSFCSQARS